MPARFRKARGGLLIVLSAPSGAGKTTVVNKWLQKDRRLWRSVSATTRPRRNGERNGRDYFFLSKSQFVRKIKTGQFLEWARVFGSYYGTPRGPVRRRRLKGYDVVLVIDVKGAFKVMREQKVFSIFLMPPSLKELARRLGGRNTDSSNEQRKRLSLAKKEMTYARHYDAVVVNRKLGWTVSEIMDLVKKARLGLNNSLLN
ncbi:MAG: guanylate kinase [Candidatus Omnitrophica bacterium]|nr:guanylate kinase [Candidatus Omnitrophota bacterium]